MSQNGKCACDQVLETPTAKEGCCEEMLDSIEETLEQPTDAAYILGQLKVLVTHLRESLKFGHQTPQPKEEVLEMDGFMGRVKMPLYNPTWSHHTPPSNSEKEEVKEEKRDFGDAIERLKEYVGEDTKKEAMLKIAREAAEEQKKVMESSPNSK